MRFTAPPQLSILFYIHSVPFTEDVLMKRSSLGGSESACRVLAEALAARGHDVHIFATQLKAPGEYFGVFWHDASELVDVLRFTRPDVFVSLRMPGVFKMDIPAKLRMIWNQDLMTTEAFNGQLFALDRALFVSEYHAKQWCEKAKMLRPIAHVIKNPIDPNDLAAAGIAPEGATNTLAIAKRPHSFIHISRPERGMDGLLALWPKIRQAIPDATLSICRYSSMYDAGGWGKVCASYDRMVDYVNRKVGGISYLGELDKVQLYRAIAEHQVMLYPTSQHNFAETNCVAATEAQACGTPFVGSWRGALPETVHPDAGVLIPGDVTDEAVQDAFVEACVRIVRDPALYSRMVVAGRQWAAKAYGPAVAETFERDVLEMFEDRYNRNKRGVLRQLLHWDNHAAARLVAQEIIAETAHIEGPCEAHLEAVAAAALCDRVIRQEEQTAEHYAKYAIQDPVEEADTNQRLHVAAESVAEDSPRVVLDVACGNGAMALVLARALPQSTIIGVDYSEGVIALAQEAAKKEGAERVQFHLIDGSLPLADELRRVLNTVAPAADGRPRVDAVFCGEFIEHVEKPWELLDTLEQFVEADGRIVLTTPCGPFAELLNPGVPRQRGHVHAFSLRDLSTMGFPKRDWAWRYLGIGASARGTECGYWIMQYRPGGQPAGVLDYTHTILTERPYQTIHACMIVRDASRWLRACLESFRMQVDKIVVVDTGSEDDTVDLARKLGAEVHEIEWPDDFSIARNVSLDLALVGDPDWIFWIDADEELKGAPFMRRYAVDGGTFNGYAIHQHHLMLDAPHFHDTPVRLFRVRPIGEGAGETPRFYGVVHEQPEFGPDKGILPALDQVDLKLIHRGYEENAVRRRKMLQRNLPLLMREIESGQARELAWVLYMRDCVNIALFQKEANGNRLTASGLAHIKRAIEVYRERGFDDPTSSCHRIAFIYYQQALELSGNAIQVGWAFAAGQGGLQKLPRLGTYWAADGDEAERIANHRIKTWCDSFRQRIDVEPVVIRTPEDAVRAQPGRIAGGRGWELPEWRLGNNRRAGDALQTTAQ